MVLVGDEKMRKYHKIQTVFLRDPSTNYRTLLDGRYAKPEFEYLKNNTWVFTEKVDGTNIRVYWDGNTVTFSGKTDNSNIPKFLLAELENMFQPDIFFSKEIPPMCLYGEGYGAKIQNGGRDYIPDGVSFILFDARAGEVWLERHNLEDIASRLGINIVPIVGKGTLVDGIEMVKNGFKSDLRETPPEGLVMRPDVEMLSRRGERIITKIKIKDMATQKGKK